MPMTLVSTVTVGTGSPVNIEFTNIPQTGKDLLIKVSFRMVGTSGGAFTNFDIYKNNSGPSTRNLQGNGSSVSSNSGGGALLVDGSATSNTFSNGEFYIANYTQAINHSFSYDGVTENAATSAAQQIMAGNFAFNSAAATNIILQQGNGFAQYSTASLYIIS